MNKECCEKCNTIYTEKDYPEHTIINACSNPTCECHTQNKDFDLRREKSNIVEAMQTPEKHTQNNWEEKYEALYTADWLTPAQLKEKVKELFRVERETLFDRAHAIGFRDGAADAYNTFASTREAIAKEIERKKVEEPEHAGDGRVGAALYSWAKGYNNGLADAAEIVRKFKR